MLTKKSLQLGGVLVPPDSSPTILFIRVGREKEIGGRWNMSKYKCMNCLWIKCVCAKHDFPACADYVDEPRVLKDRMNYIFNEEDCKR